MHRPILRTLPLAVALAFGSGLALAQTSNSSANTGPNHSTLAGVSAAQPGSPADTSHAMGATGTKSDKSTAKADKKISRGDKEFIEDAAKGGMAEVEIGKLAAQKGSDPAVKEFGNKLAQDHGKANDELTQLAQAKGVKMPDKAKWSERHEDNKLQKMSGADFDREFAQHSVKDHEKDIKKFEKAASKLDDPDLKAWAEKQLPTLREHLAMAQKLPGAGGEKNASAGKTDKSDTRAAGAKGSKS